MLRAISGRRECCTGGAAMCIPIRPRRSRSARSLALAAAIVSGCGAPEGSPGQTPTLVPEAFVTRSSILSNLDSPAVWHGPFGQDWVVTTSKSRHRLYVHDAATGGLVTTVGGRGAGPVQFRRPNGLAIVGDLVLVVERDNARVQVLRLPGFDFVSTFGEETLRRPYGIAVLRRGPALDVFITDDYAVGGAADPGLDERIKRYRLDPASAAAGAAYLGAFGDAVGAGRLLKVESLAVDPEAGLLLVADEEAVDVKVYDVDGAFTGRVLWGDVIRHEPEGIVLYPCGREAGYWILADQHRRENRFLVFERRHFELLGAFTGGTVRNTDGVALTQERVGDMAAGALYAVHADRAVGAFSWSEVAAALGVRDDCEPPLDPRP